jgi:hypothetical protein
MSIATLNKYKKLLKNKIKYEGGMIKAYETANARFAANILDYKDQIEDIDTALLILKKHIPLKGKK